jgi:hypothetical protein
VLGPDRTGRSRRSVRTVRRRRGQDSMTPRVPGSRLRSGQPAGGRGGVCGLGDRVQGRAINSVTRFFPISKLLI